MHKIVPILREELYSRVAAVAYRYKNNVFHVAGEWKTIQCSSHLVYMYNNTCMFIIWMCKQEHSAYRMYGMNEDCLKSTWLVLLNISWKHVFVVQFGNMSLWYSLETCLCGTVLCLCVVLISGNIISYKRLWLLGTGTILWLSHWYWSILKGYG